MSMQYQPVPVEAARRIAENYSKAIVIIAAWDETAGMLHITTYGGSAQDKVLAAAGGEIVAKALGASEQEVTFEDFRVDRYEALHTLQPADKYHEDMGAVLWWKLPVNEPPYVGDPLCSDWPGTHTHFTPLPDPKNFIGG